jgi:hypothetical protein
MMAAQGSPNTVPRALKSAPTPQRGDSHDVEQAAPTDMTGEVAALDGLLIKDDGDGGENAAMLFLPQ